MSLSTPPLLADNYRYLQDFVQRNSGIVLDQTKQYLVESRLSPIVRAHGLGSINDLCNLLRGTRDPQIERTVVEAMTTNETYFFRDPAQYDAIRTALLPEIRQRKRIPNFWSAAASTGQEAYSLAMMLAETDSARAKPGSWERTSTSRCWPRRAPGDTNNWK